jgi:hypothetical protein
MDRITLMDITKIGPGIWFKIHTDGIAAITQSLKESFIVNINALCDGFKCKHCQPHFRKYINEHPIENYFNIKNKKGIDIGIFQWTWEFHNAVNLRLGKHQPTLEESYEYFTNNTIGACTECGQNKDINVKNDAIVKRVTSIKNTNQPIIVKYEGINTNDTPNQFKPYTFKSANVPNDKQFFPFKMYNK